MFTQHSVGAILESPAKKRKTKNGRFVNRPYKQISAENLFSLPICVIMGLAKSLPCVKGGGTQSVTEGL